MASWRGSVAGITGVPTAPRVVEASLGAVMLATARAASRAATGAAAEESGNRGRIREQIPGRLLALHSYVIVDNIQLKLFDSYAEFTCSLLEKRCQA